MIASTEMTAVARARQLLASGEGRRIREASLLSLEEFGAALEVDPTTVLRWETGEHRPRAKHAVRYARFLQQLDCPGSMAGVEARHA